MADAAPAFPSAFYADQQFVAEIERWFFDLTQNHLRHGVFKNVAQLEHGIREYIHHHNAHPISFVWTR